MAFQNIAIIGGTGTLGAPILEALKASPFTIYVLNRQSSKSEYSDVNVITIPDDLNVPDVARLFQEHKIDALVIVIKGSYVEQPKKLIEAAFKSGVKRVIPADFGSCDSTDQKTNELMPLYGKKIIVRDYLISLQDEVRDEGREKLSWTSLITGHFFDWGLERHLLYFDVKNRKAYILDGGDIKFSGSNLPFIGQAVIRILQKPAETVNKVLYVHSHHVTQNELLATLEKVTGQKWEKLERSSEHEISISRPKMLEGDFDAYEEVVAVWGIVASDWKNKETFANELLGLEEEDLEETVRKVVAKLQ